MKTAIIKQIYDAHGPWSSIKWQDTNPEKLFDIWPSKSTFWEMTCLLKADWYVIAPSKLKSDYVKDILKNPARMRIMEKYTKNVVDVKDIPFTDYDLVITLDPILEIPKQSKTLFAYYVQEHWDRLYQMSHHGLVGNYDLFLDHMMDAKSELVQLPRAISFPYLYNPDMVRSVFKSVKRDEVWADWRLLTALGMTNLWSKSAKEAAKRLEKLIGIPVRHGGNFNQTPLGISDPPLWGDAVGYLKILSQCKYYIAVGRYSGAGQGLCEAASLGSICIGEQDKIYHRMICHPDCLCSDMVSMPQILRRLISSPKLQQEALDYQNRALEHKFVKEPLAMLEKAVKMKQKLC